MFMKIVQFCLIVISIILIIKYNPKYFNTNYFVKQFNSLQLFKKEPFKQECDVYEDVFNTEGALTEDADVAISDALKSVING